MITAASSDARHVIAYGLILLIVLGLAAAWLYLSREWRAERRAFIRHRSRRRRERRAEDARPSAGR